MELHLGEPIDPAGVEPICPPCWGGGTTVVLLACADGRLVCPACGRSYPTDEMLDADDS